MVSVKSLLILILIFIWVINARNIYILDLSWLPCHVNSSCNNGLLRIYIIRLLIATIEFILQDLKEVRFCDSGERHNEALTREDQLENEYKRIIDIDIAICISILLVEHIQDVEPCVQIGGNEHYGTQHMSLPDDGSRLLAHTWHAHLGRRIDDARKCKSQVRKNEHCSQEDAC